MDGKGGSTGSPRVWIVVLNWNGWQYTSACLESLRRQTCPPGRVVVVDNGSTDGSVKKIWTQFPEVEAVPLERNEGFAAGNNIGIQKALAAGADYVWLLNNDTDVHPDSLSLLVAAAEENRRVGILTPWVCTISPHSGRGFTGTAVKDIRTDGPASAGTPARFVYRAVFGTAMFVRAELFRRVGLLDERFFIYYEDDDLSIRAARAGFLLGQVAEARVVHAGSASMASSGAVAPAKAYLKARNRILLVRKHAPHQAKCAILGRCIAAAADASRAYRRQGLDAQADAVLAGVLDGLAGRFGPPRPRRISRLWRLPASVVSAVSRSRVLFPSGLTLHQRGQCRRKGTSC